MTQVFDTPEKINAFKLATSKAAIKLEALGMRHSRVNVTAMYMKHYGIPGRATAKNRELVLQKIQQELDQIKQELDFNSTPPELIPVAPGSGGN
jgi:hypothetical protein